ncbi:RHS repeat domain-containing protein, partial [Treponema pedis]|uniref:RHS repeat domain-containing protein n=1 Tax=Treponema pedis TaxID=409322 RepID=UPI0004637995
MKVVVRCLLKEPNYLFRTAIAREQKQFTKIAFAVHLSAVIPAERYRSDSGALKSAVLNFIFFMIIINKMQQSAAQSCLGTFELRVLPFGKTSGTKLLNLLNRPTDRTFGNRWSRYKEPSKNKAEAYLVYVEHLFLRSDAGDARIFSKEMTHTENQGDNEEQKAKRYYYHSDHLGSAQFVTDWRGKQYEHIEYTPYGELWIEETAPGIDKLPFRFTGKELDEETGLYYYGARYLDPKYSRWLSGDPALGEYMAGSSVGEGGIYNTVNFNVYHYGGNNPIKYIDPTG